MSRSSSLSAERAAPAIQSKRLLIGLYIVVALLYWISLYVYMPTLPTYAQGKTGSLAMVGVVLAQYGLWQAIIRLPVGIASDWVGRRKVFIVVGISLAGLGAWIMGRAGGTAGLIVGRAITGLACGTWVPLTVAFSGLFPAQQAVRATALLSAVSNAGRIVGTSATGALNGLGGYSLAFNLAAGVAGLGVLMLLAIREAARPPRQPSLRGIGSLVSRRDVLIPSLLQAVAQYATWAVPFGFVPILARQLGATDVMQSLLMSLNIGMVMAGGLVTAALANRIGGCQLAYLSFGILALGIGVAAVAPSLGVLFAAQFLLGLSQGIGYPVMMGMSIEQVIDAQRATAMGVHQSVYAIGMFAGPSLSGLLADAVGIRPMFGMTAFACLAIGLFLLSLLPKKQQNPDYSQ